MRTSRIVGALTAISLAFVACDDSDDGQYVLSATEVGDDPFVADVANAAPAEFVALEPRLDDAAEAITRDDGSIDPVERSIVEAALVDELMDEGADVKPAPSPSGVAIYGGSGTNACDVEQLVDFLTSTPEKGAAFAQVHGIEVAGIPAFIDSLEAGFLLLPTPTINHGFKDGGPIARPETVLEAGTAVLLDSDGIPRVRCKCGNPQLPPKEPVVPPETTIPDIDESENDEITRSYPDQITLDPSITEEPAAYPLGLPPKVRLDFGEPSQLTAEEIENLIVVTDAVRRSVKLTVLDGPNAGETFDFGDVVVPTGWRQEDLVEDKIISWTNLRARSAETGFIALETPVADIRYVSDVTYAGYVVDSTGTLSISFPFKGDGEGGLLGVGLELSWKGAMRCVIVNEAPVDNFEPSKNCPDYTGDMFWDWGVNTVSFG